MEPRSLWAQEPAGLEDQGAKPNSLRLKRTLLQMRRPWSNRRERYAKGGELEAFPSRMVMDSAGFEATRPGSLGARGPCVSRPPTIPGVGPLPCFLRLGVKPFTPRLENHGGPHPSNPDSRDPSPAGFWSDSSRSRKWCARRDSNLRGLEASGPEAPAFQGRLRFPGWGPSLVFYGSEPSSWLLASKTTGVPTLRIPIPGIHRPPAFGRILRGVKNGALGGIRTYAA